METAQLAIQLKAAATPRATARIRLGNISPSISHMYGPQVTPKKNVNTLAATRAMMPQGSGRETRSSPPGTGVT